jgi:hypothetical protein
MDQVSEDGARARAIPSWASWRVLDCRDRLIRAGVRPTLELVARRSGVSKSLTRAVIASATTFDENGE